MTLKRTPLIIVIMSGVFLFLDRWLKWKAMGAMDVVVPERWIGWQPFLNSGIAFGIVLPTSLVVLVTLFIIAAVLYLVYYYLRIAPKNVRASVFYGLTLIIIGAISNLVDRVYYGSAVDYLRIYMSIINLADCFIVVGFVVYFSSLKHLK